MFIYLVALDKSADSLYLELCFGASIVCKYKYVIKAAGLRVKICMFRHVIMTSAIMSADLVIKNNSKDRKL